MQQFLLKRFLLAVLIFALALAVRMPGLGSFMTADEENWMIRSGSFWNELFRNHNPGGTFMTTHPGASVMWVAGAGIFWQEHRLGFDIDTSNLQYFRRAALLPVVVVVAFLIAMVAWQLLALLGWPGGMLASLFLALDPYLLGMSQIVHLDALLAFSMLNAVLGLMVYAHTRRQLSLVISAVALGLAMATKLLPSLWGLVVVGCVLLWVHMRRWQNIVRDGGFILGVAVLTFWVLWPALWAKADLQHSFQKDVPSIVTDEHIAVETSADPILPATFYPRTVLERTQPIVLLLCILYVVFRIWRSVRVRSFRLTEADWLILYALGFLVLITFVAKKGDRYALPALAVLPVLAGMGLVRIFNLKFDRLVLPTAMFVILASIAFTIWQYNPYAIAYTSPLFPNIQSFTQQGWGEGLDAAAAWLNQKPFVDRLYVASWYPSVLGTYFQGQTLSLSSRDDHRVGYVVLYRNMMGRAPDDIASNVLDQFAAKTPEHIVYIHGVPYAWIYNTIGPYYFRSTVGELVPGVEVGQQVPVAVAGWSHIDVALATYGRVNSGSVRLAIYESPTASVPVREVEVDAAHVLDQDWQSFEFDPIPDSAGKTYYVSLEGVGTSAGHAVTVRYDNDDVKPGQAYIIRDGGTNGGRDAYLKQGDLGYRIHNN